MDQASDLLHFHLQALHEPWYGLGVAHGELKELTITTEDHARKWLSIKEGIAIGDIPKLDDDPICGCCCNREQPKFDGVHPRICLRRLNRDITTVATMGFQYREKLSTVELGHLRDRLKLVYLYLRLFDEWIVEVGGNANLLDAVRGVMDDIWLFDPVEAYQPSEEPEEEPFPISWDDDGFPALCVRMQAQEEVDLLKRHHDFVCKR